MKLLLKIIKKQAKNFGLKYFYVAKLLGENAKPEEVLKVMESLAGVAMKQKVKNKIGPFGFNKTDETQETN